MIYQEKKNKIRKIATEVRKELQGLSHLNYGSEPRKIRKDLRGYCRYGSVMVHEALAKNGFKSKIVGGSEHWFVVCGNLLVDITASQFSQPKVVVRNYKEVKRIIKTGECLMYFWKANKFSGSAKLAGLGDALKQINKAREKARAK